MPEHTSDVDGDASSFGPVDDLGDDFYRAVNRRWLESNPVPPEYGSWGSFREVHVRNEALLRHLLDDAASNAAPPGTAERMAGDYWAAALDEATIEAAGIDPIVELLDLVDRVTDAASAVSAAAVLRRSGVGMLIGSYVSPDFYDSSRYLLYVLQGGLGLPERDYYFRDDDHSVGLRSAYQEHIANVLALAGRDTDPASAAAAIVDLETALADHSFTPTQLRDTDLTTNKVERAAFDGFAGLDLGSYLEHATGRVPEVVNLNNPEFFTHLGQTLAAVDPATLRSYLRWHVVRAAAPSLSRDFVEASFDFYGRRLGGQRELKPRWQRALAAASADIGQQVSKLYVAAAFSPDAKERCEAMVERLITAMGDAIEELDWMGTATKAEARRKLAGFTYKIGYPDVWRDYSDLVIERSSFAANRLRASAFEYRRQLAKLEGPVDKDDWFMPPHAVNAYYHQTYNEIVFPAGILQPPFFRADADEATNLGGIGTVIGHEITHGFDDQGSKFDATGNLTNWWTEEDRAAFEQRAEGLVTQYGAYEAVDGVNVNGELTLGENIADLGGLKVAYKALLASLADQGIDPDTVGADGLSARQRFFVSFATIWRENYTDEYLRLLVTSDPHSPHELRCNGALVNFPPFADAFGLDASSSLVKPAGTEVAIW